MVDKSVHINGSTISQSPIITGDGNTVTFTLTSAAKQDLASLVAELKKLDISGLDQDSQAEYHCDVQTIESQLHSPKPKKGIIQESLSSLRTIVEGVTGSIIAAPITAPILSSIKSILSSMFP